MLNFEFLILIKQKYILTYKSILGFNYYYLKIQHLIYGDLGGSLKSCHIVKTGARFRQMFSTPQLCQNLMIEGKLKYIYLLLYCK